MLKLTFEFQINFNPFREFHKRVGVMMAVMVGGGGGGVGHKYKHTAYANAIKYIYYRINIHFPFIKSLHNKLIIRYYEEISTVSPKSVAIYSFYISQIN